MSAFDLPTFFKEVLQLTDEALIQRAQEISEVWEVKKGECVVKQGDTVANVLFLIDGIFRGYFSSSNGKRSQTVSSPKPVLQSCPVQIF